MDTQNDGLEMGTPALNMAIFWVSMLIFGGGKMLGKKMFKKIFPPQMVGFFHGDESYGTIRKRITNKNKQTVKNHRKKRNPSFKSIGI